MVLSEIKKRITLLLISIYLVPLVYSQSTNGTNAREVLSLNKGWRFFQGDIPMPLVTGHSMTYSNAKAGTAWGAAAPEYDDSKWRLLNLPHDWAIESVPDSTQNESQGYHMRGIGWYRRSFTLPETDKGKHLELQFDGIASHCTVWVNGTLVHRNFSGYTSFYIDITPFAYYGAKTNTISVRVDANVQEGWWYEGAGIYRNTWLVKRSPLHIITDGVFANPVKTDDKKWLLPVEVTLENSGKKTAVADIETKLFDSKGVLVQQDNTKITVGNLARAVSTLSMYVSQPELWDVETPVLYKVETKIKQNGNVIDSLITTCGFRTIYFSPDSGLYLNGINIKIKGTCNHQDHAGVGVAVPSALWEFRLGKLKELGSNAYRCAHNPPAKEFLDECDRIGMLVMDETRNFNVSPEYIRQLEWMVRRDRNHPSVFLWSVFNEEPMQGTENGYEMVRRMYSFVKAMDTTRPVTAAANGGLLNPINVAHAVDVIGMNYQSDQYDAVHKAFPGKPLTSSEDVSGLMIRGEYKTVKEKQIHDSYDTQFPGWGTTHRVGWQRVAERPFVAGCFVWTGFDYHGEPQPYKWPASNASFGIMDQCGFPKTAFYLHQAQWVENRPLLQIVPHWNWPPDSLGKKIKVMVLTNADSVALWLNGKFVSGQKNDIYEMSEWMVSYKPGTLEARGYKNGKETIRSKVETTGQAIALQLIPYKAALAGDGSDAMPVTVQAIDAKGRIVPTANMKVSFSVSGYGKVIGLGNGDPNSHEPEKGNERSLFHGLAQIIIQSVENGKESIVIKASSPGLKNATLSIPVKEVASIPSVDVPVN